MSDFNVDREKKFSQPTVHIIHLSKRKVKRFTPIFQKYFNKFLCLSFYRKNLCFLHVFTQKGLSNAVF